MAKARITKTPCVVRTGTPNSLTEWHNYDSEQRARTAATKFFKGHEEFAAGRRGAGGRTVVLAAVDEVSNLPIINEGRIVRCMVDPYTEFEIVVEIAHGVWDPQLKRVIIP